MQSLISLGNKVDSATMHYLKSTELGQLKCIAGMNTHYSKYITSLTTTTLLPDTTNQYLFCGKMLFR
jgi:hypothetical protein